LHKTTTTNSSNHTCLFDGFCQVLQGSAGFVLQVLPGSADDEPCRTSNEPSRTLQNRAEPFRT